MSEQTDNLTGLLTPFGLTQEEAQIYLVLLENGVLSALSISRKVKLGRTKVYRLLDRLIALGLVSSQFDEVGFKFRAEPPEKLELMVNLKQAEVSVLQTSLPNVRESLLRCMGSGGEGSKVLYYQGNRGLRQVNFNLLRAHGELLSFELETANAFMDLDEAEEMRRELVKNRIKTRTITNATHIRPFTQVSELVEKYWEMRYIPKERFTIKAEVFVYNEVYLLYRYTDSDVFAVEIYNSDLATMQRQVFNLLWEKAQPMKVLNERGEARVGEKWGQR